MQLDTDDWVTAADAARLLGCSTQRVFTMVTEDGSLEGRRPWPRVLLIERRSIDAWLAGQRQPRILPADAKRFVLKRAGVDSVHLVNPSDMEGWLDGFIADSRPRWDRTRRDEWIAETTARLLTSGRS